MALINDRYELRREIRRGGFGVTWYAWDTRLDMPVAVKEFSDPDPAHRQKFLREARTLARFSGDRGIVNVRDYLEEDGKAYMVMEYLEGEDLSTYVDKRGKLGFEETMRLLRPVMNVLDRLHEAQMLHRDVSPDNIRLTSDGEVKLLDFGSVTNLTNENLTMTVTVKPGYAPVEQYSGSAGIGAFTDVYSMAATIYKCITGRKPMDSLARSFHDDLKRPSELGADITPEAEEVLMKGLSVRPDERYASMQALAEAFQSAEAAANAGSSTSTSDLAAAAFRDDVKAPDEGTGSGKVSSDLAAKAFADDALGGSAQGQNLAEAASSSAGKQAENADLAEDGGERGRSGKKDRRAGRKRKMSKKVLIPLILAGVVLIGAIAFFVSRGGSALPALTKEGVEYEKGDISVTFKDLTITEDEIRFVERLEEVYIVYFRKCQISDEMMQKIAGWSRVSQMSFIKCTGYQSMDPLASSGVLTYLDINEEYDGVLAGDRLFTTDFPARVEHLGIYCGSLEGTTEFIRHFPGLTFLNFHVKASGADMAFLESLPRLQYLYIYDQIMDEAACAHLYGHPDLHSVGLNDTSLASLGWAEECAGLYQLEADNSLVTDLSPLADHTSLTFLSLNGAPLSDLTPLAGCSSLYNLSLNNTEVESLAGLEGHDKLQSLYVHRCHLTDLSPLAGCDLHNLDIAWNKVTTLTPISGAVNMGNLNVTGNELTDLAGCEDMIKLTYLRAPRNHLKDISAIRNSTTMKLLMLSKNEITDISALGNDFLDLESLDLSDNQVADIGALAKCSKLKVFAADNNKITSVQGLAGKPELYAVFISNNSVSDLNPLRDGMNTLSYLDIGNNAVSDVSFLKDLSVKRVWLLMENNQISDISMLPQLLNYRQLILYGNPITDVSVLAGMENSTGGPEFYISYQEGMDYASLGSGPFYSAVIVDTPSDKKAGVLKEFKGEGWHEPTFMTKEEADDAMAAHRAEIKSTVIGEEEEAEEENE